MGDMNKLANASYLYDCCVCAERLIVLSKMNKKMHEKNESCKKIYHLKNDREGPDEVNAKVYSHSQL